MTTLDPLLVDEVLQLVEADPFVAALFGIVFGAGVASVWWIMRQGRDDQNGQ